MRENHEGQIFWTGLPSGEVHERICREGML